MKQILLTLSLSQLQIADPLLKNLLAKFQHAALHDTLTGLPNRLLLKDRLQTGIKKAKRSNKILAVLFIDLDKFKSINDNHGHKTGDLVLKQAASRIQNLLRDSDTVARIGGDEFVVVLEDLKETADAEKVARLIVKKLNEPFLVGKSRLINSCSIGMDVYPRTTTATSLMKNADSALYAAKATGRNCYKMYGETVVEKKP